MEVAAWSHDIIDIRLGFTPVGDVSNPGPIILVSSARNGYRRSVAKKTCSQLGERWTGEFRVEQRRPQTFDLFFRVAVANLSSTVVQGAYYL
jgi:hypothetical protein